MTHHPDLKSLAEKVQQRTREQHDDIVRFMREICAIPSMNSLIGPVGERIQAEMRKLGFDEVRFDKMGNTIGRIGDGPKVIVYDSHIDTVGIGDRDEWEWDPFEGKVEDGLLYARGACDEKGSTPGLCVRPGAWRAIWVCWTATPPTISATWKSGATASRPTRSPKLIPAFAPISSLIGEPTKMRVYRGHKGRIELKITASGRSAHAASHYLGDNAVYKMMAIITQIRELDRRMRFGMGYHPVQGYPSIAVTDVEARTASLNAVPDQFTIYIDRRITSNEPRDEVIALIKGLIPDYLQDEIHVEELFYDEPSLHRLRLSGVQVLPALAAG